MDRAGAGEGKVSRTAGLVGLGQMGSGLARNLDAAVLLHAGFDSRPGAFEAAALSSDVATMTPGEMARNCDIILFCVSTSAQIESCLDGPDGILANGRAGRILVDLTTADPQDTRRLAEQARQAGLPYLDAAMTGGAAGAAAGRLTLMIGGDADAVAVAEPVLSAISERRFHLGPVGSGHTMKLVHNLILHASFMATCEGLQLAETSGIDLAKAVEVLNAGNARSFVTERRFPDHIVSGRFDARSRVANLSKDLAMAVALADQMDKPARYGALTSDLLRSAEAEGLADEDFSRLYLHIEALETGLGQEIGQRR